VNGYIKMVSLGAIRWHRRKAGDSIFFSSDLEIASSCTNPSFPLLLFTTPTKPQPPGPSAFHDKQSSSTPPPASAHPRSLNTSVVAGLLWYFTLAYPAPTQALPRPHNALVLAELCVVNNTLAGYPTHFNTTNQ
jgi:hypothetical protein